MTEGRKRSSKIPTGGRQTQSGSSRPRARKRFGQHFLESAWVSKLIAAIRPAPNELFVEIGPGTGQLTLPLAASGARVLAIEVDRDLSADLRRHAPSNVQIITGDILSQDLAGLVAAAAAPDASRPVRVVANLPYNLSSPILFQILETQRTSQCFRDATLMMQREVADRVISSPGSRTYGPLAILTRLAADAQRVFSLPPGAFRPPPRVRSAVVSLSFRPQQVTIANLDLFERMVRSLFTLRRKTMLNALGPVASALSALTPRELLDRAGLDSQRRPETLDLEELATLVETLRVTLRRPE
jgi:16S rRNA (adenine1518-N6/adenine1519-N6)-dimethyltransferase